MQRIGITGGIGMGKSAAAGNLAQMSVPVIDTDLIARELVAPGEPALEEIVAAFGHPMLTSSGALDRDAMAQLVFSDAVARARLESILHPRIRSAWVSRMEELEGAGVSRAAVVIPLLFETAAESLLDWVVCVACTKQTQWERLRARGWSDAHILQRVQSQMPIEEKIECSDFLIWTEGVMEWQTPQWERILRSCQL